MTIADIEQKLAIMSEHDYQVSIFNDPWYSEKALTRALGGDVTNCESQQCVRVRLKRGILELTPENDMVRVMCYCCFVTPSNSHDHGLVSLNDVRKTVVAMKDHYCPPWPG